jgi:transcriptional regulator with XRE-family HTH domain
LTRTGHRGVPVEIVAEWSGHHAYALRISLRLTIEDFAQHLGMSPRAVAKWEANRDAVPAMGTQQLLDVALNRAPADAKARFAQLAEQHATAPTQTPTPALLDLATPVSLLSPASPRRATQPALDWYASSLREQYSADNTVGPALLLPAMTTHVQAIEQMVKGTEGALLDELLRVGAGYAEFAGWLSHDAGDLGAARRWYALAREWADAADDRRMLSWVLMRRAVQAIGDGDGAYGVRLAAAAQRDTSTGTLRVRAIAAQTEALAHALLGDASAVERQLDAAAQLTAAAGADVAADDPSGGGRYCELPLYLRISRAKCHLTLGQAEQAVQSFGAVLDALPPSYHRDRGQYLARLATASALADLPEEACGQAQESLSIAIATGSSRTATDVARFTARAARRWPTLPEVRTLRDMLGSIATDRKA